MLYSSFVIVTTLLLIFSFAPLLRSEVWWIRGLDFPRLQFFIASILLVTIEVLVLEITIFHNQVLIGTGILCALYLAVWIVPYTVFFKKEVEASQKDEVDNQVRIMVVNVLISNRESSKILRLIKKHAPDIIVTLETNQWWENQLDPIKKEYPQSIKYPLENSYGMHVYSKFILIEKEIRFLIEEDVPSMRAKVILPSGKKVQMHFLHPAPPSPTENETSEERDAELLIIAKEISKKEEEPVVVMGDLNDVAWSYTTRLFRKTSRLLDPRIGRGMFNTYNAKFFFIRWPLDHLFHSSHFQLVQVKLLPFFSSDHFPIFIELALTSELGEENKGLDSTQGDEKEADEKIEKIQS